MKDLVDLLLHWVKNLHLAEEQMASAIPGIIEKANHSSLKNALKHHAGLTTQQMQRLAKIPHLINEKITGAAVPPLDYNIDKAISQGMAGLIEEANHLLSTNLPDELKDAAIIASVQKMEHYEICAYGTALAFANQLQLTKVAVLLHETLDEEYDVDDLLTALATAAINKEGLPEGLDTQQPEKNTSEMTAEPSEHNSVLISERTISSPGGRAGTSHRRYANGESRGH